MSHSDSDDASFHSQEEGESNYEQNYKLHYLIWEQDYSNVAKYIRKVLISTKNTCWGLKVADVSSALIIGQLILEKSFTFDYFRY